MVAKSFVTEEEVMCCPSLLAQCYQSNPFLVATESVSVQTCYKSVGHEILTHCFTELSLFKTHQPLGGSTNYWQFSSYISV